MHEYRRDIDGLRAIAVATVVLFHFRVAGFEGGVVGVDVFFVISGFLITKVVTRELDADAFSFASFYERRARRLFPALYVMLVCSIPFAVMVLGRGAYKRYSEAFTAASGFVANVFFWRTTDYFDAPGERQPLLHTWSLAVEEQFYFVFPMLLVAARRWLPRAATQWVLALSGALSFYFAFWKAVGAHSDVFYLPQYRAWELCLGAWVASSNCRAKRLSEGLTVVGLGMILFSVVALSQSELMPVPVPLFACAGAAFILASTPDTRTSRLLGAAPLVFIGLISYSLYLVHWPVWVFAQGFMLTGVTAAERALLVALAVALATLSWRFVERPFRGSKGLGTRRGIAMASIGCIAVAVIIMPRVLAALAPTLSPETRALLALGESRFVFNCRDPKADGDKCIVGASSAPITYLLWGDSHAMALAEGMVGAAGGAIRRGVVLSGAGCPPLLGVSSTWHDGECVVISARAAQVLEAHRSIRTVFLAARWSLYAQAANMVRQRMPPLVDDERQVKNHTDVVTAGLSRTLKLLEERGVRVVLFEQVPEVGWHVPTTMAHAWRLRRDVPPGPSLAEHRDRQRPFQGILRELRKRHRFEVIDLAESMCDGTMCRVHVDGMPLYRDTHHPSAQGSAWLLSRANVFDSGRD